MTTTQTAEQLAEQLANNIQNNAGYRREAAAMIRSQAAEIETLKEQVRLLEYAVDVSRNLKADLGAKQAAEIERLRRARNLYESALLAQNQQGAIGEVFELWNAARAALEKQA